MPTDSVAEFEVDVREDRTIVTVEGQRDVAIVVRSDEGERIYLPPEDAVGAADAVPAVNPYTGASAPEAKDDNVSPYDQASDASGSGSGPAGGRRIVHDEQATDVRVLR